MSEIKAMAKPSKASGRPDSRTAYFVKTGDNDSVNGHIAGIDAVIECYNRYPKTLKKDKKKILAFKKMQEEGTLRQYVIDNIGK